ncbi:MAG: hypothetical protein KAU17_13025 [Spirochaetales bacterium]|nr:hypothetical protein [Spirochaetales bacterium]
MKLHLFSLFICILIIPISQAAFGQQMNLIPRRVCFDLINPVTEGSPLLDELDDLYYAVISEFQPIVRIDNPEEADSIIVIRIDGDSAQIAITPRVLQQGELLLFEEYWTAPEIPDYAAFLAFIETSSKEIARTLTMVEPIVVETEYRRYTKELIDQVSLADSLAAPWEIGLWSSGFFADLNFDNTSPVFKLRVFPVIPEAVWYFKRNSGLVMSFYSDYNKIWSFGEYESDNSRGVTDTLLLMPGVGIAYRTLDRISAGASAVLYLGPAWVRNPSSTDAIVDSRDETTITFLEPGQTKVILYSLLHLSASLSWNITEKYSLKTRLGLFVHPTMLMGGNIPLPYPEQGNGMFFSYFALGFAYRL